MSISEINGVFAGGMSCGIKTSGKDLSFIFVPNAVACSVMLTKNRFAAPCIAHARKVVQENTVKAVIVNSGNANAATGEQGMRDVVRTAELVAEQLGIRAEEVAVASTGIIGVHLPMPTLERGIARLLKDPRQKDGASAAEAILTTDTCTKEVLLEREIAGKTVRVAGMTKGSGMIAPDMATMLGFLATDANVEQSVLDELLHEAVDRSFNMVTVDTDTSTNDMVLAFASGEVAIDCENTVVRQGLLELLTEACISLAKQIARDGEGASKLIEVQVHGALDERSAQAIAKSIAASPLVKTAVHGEDPNWGRVIMAAGKVPDVEIDPEKMEVSFAGMLVFAGGQPTGIARAEVAQALAGDQTSILVDLNLGEAQATCWGCDLTKGYIDINTDYN